LNPLGQYIAAVEPHPRVWRSIKREISAEGRTPTSFWDNLLLWRATAFTAVLLLSALIVYQVTTPARQAPTPSYVAVLVNEQQAPMIVATATRHPRRLIIMMMQKPQPARRRDLELWAIPKAGGAPVSIGLLSEDQETLIELDAREIRMMPKTGVLAISREPEGGSPTGSPTGPVVYQGPLVSL
jgi:anti-sigma-K factor RskA